MKEFEQLFCNNFKAKTTIQTQGLFFFQAYHNLANNLYPALFQNILSSLQFPRTKRPQAQILSGSKQQTRVVAPWREGRPSWLMCQGRTTIYPFIMLILKASADKMCGVFWYVVSEHRGWQCLTIEKWSVESRAWNAHTQLHTLHFSDPLSFDENARSLYIYRFLPSA